MDDEECSTKLGAKLLGAHGICSKVCWYKFWSHGCNSAARNLVKLFEGHLSTAVFPIFAIGALGFCLANAHF